MTLDISGQVIEQKLSLITGDKKGILETAMFGNTFFGQTKTISAFLVNSGPQPLNFSMSYEDEDDVGGLVAGSGTGSLTEEQIYAKCITVSPLEGTIKGFSSIAVTITFSPLLIIPEKGFLKQHLIENREERPILRKMLIECPEMDQKIALSMQGAAITAAVRASPTTLRFGECPIHDRRDILISLSNSTKLPTSFSFPTIANFKFSPQSGLLQSLQTVSVIGSFLPPQYGVFKSVVQMAVAEGLERVEFRLMGESADPVQKTKTLVGGTDKLPEDFTVKHKFVDPEVEFTTRVEKRRAAERKAALQNSLTTAQAAQAGIPLIGGVEEATVSTTSSQERDALYGTGGGHPPPPVLYGDNGMNGTGVVALPANYIPLDATHPHIQRREHNRKYDAFLHDAKVLREEKQRQEQRKRLLQRGGIDPADPFGANMGMERGLDEPEVKLPAAGEPLWLANRQNRDGPSGGPNRLPIDENRLINKKYSSTPATQAEIRDCTAELSLEQLKLVFGSHKVRAFPYLRNSLFVLKGIIFL